MSDLTPEKITELRKLAGSVFITVQTPWYSADEFITYGVESEDDAAYIAALPPATVLELLDAADELARLARQGDAPAAPDAADYPEPEPACLIHDCTGVDVRGWEMAECTCHWSTATHSPGPGQ